jgi:hypothetical protein
MELLLYFLGFIAALAGIAAMVYAVWLPQLATDRCWREAAVRRALRFETHQCDLQSRSNALISLGLKSAKFTAKPLMYHRKHESLNQRVPRLNLNALMDR